MTIKTVAPSTTAHSSQPAESAQAPKLELIRSGAYLLRQGMKGESIRALQQQLVDRKLLKSEDADGAFGPRTLSAVKQFQQQQGLAKDGLVGPLTLGALEKKGWGASSPAPAKPAGFETSTARPAAPAPAPAPAPATVAPVPAAQVDASAAQSAVRLAAAQGPVASPAPTAAPAPAAAAGAAATAAPVSATLDAATLASLPAGTRAELQLALDGRAGSASQAGLKGLIASPGFQQASPVGRKLMLEAVDPSNLRGSLVNLGKLLTTPAFGKASEAQLEQLISVSKAGQTDALVALGSKVFDRDSQGTTLLDSAAKLASEPLQAELAPERQQLLGSALAELANPDLMLQKNHNTCAATSAEQLLARSRPSEVLRLLAGLASPAGTAKMANGDTLTRATGTERNDGSGRSASQRLLQAAMMEYGNGKASYDNASDKSVENGARRMGLVQDELATLLSALTGKPHSTRSTSQASGLLGELGAVGRVTANLLGEEGGSLHKTGAELLAGLTQRSSQDTMAVVHWGNYGHVVLVDRVADGRVYFRNPQGNQLPAGASYADEGPARRSEGGIEQSMTLADFSGKVLATVDPG